MPVTTVPYAVQESGGALLPLEILRLGRIEYGQALDFQKRRVDSCITGVVGDTLLLLEHDPVVTMGRSGLEEHLRVGEEYLKQRGVGFYRVERGGMATMHGPGQLVAYPVIRLRDRDLHAYMERVINCIVAVLRSYGLEPETDRHGPGVWVNGGKIASVGMAVRKWVSFHGMSLNVNMDVGQWRQDCQCGYGRA